MMEEREQKEKKDNDGENTSRGIKSADAKLLNSNKNDHGKLVWDEIDDA